MYEQLGDKLSKRNSLVGSLSKHDNTKNELKTLSPFKLLLSKDVVPKELEDTIKVESLIYFIAREVIRRMISRDNAIKYNITDKIALKSVRDSIRKAANLQNSLCQCIRLDEKHQKYSCPIFFRFDSHL